MTSADFDLILTLDVIVLHYSSYYSSNLLEIIVLYSHALPLQFWASIHHYYTSPSNISRSLRVLNKSILLHHGLHSPTSKRQL